MPKTGEKQHSKPKAGQPYGVAADTENGRMYERVQPSMTAWKSHSTESFRERIHNLLANRHTRKICVVLRCRTRMSSEAKRHDYYRRRKRRGLIRKTSSSESDSDRSIHLQLAVVHKKRRNRTGTYGKAPIWLFRGFLSDGPMKSE